VLLNFEDSLELIITGDGSHTIFNKNLKEYYHSTFGAITESQCVFFDNGLSKYLNQLPVISVLETGFGTGLNAFMAFLESEKYNQKIYFSGLEMFSLPISTIDDLNYTQHLNALNYKREFKALHDCAFEIEIKISNLVLSILFAKSKITVLNLFLILNSVKISLHLTTYNLLIY
jgi:hypothetical protein